MYVAGIIEQTIGSRRYEFDINAMGEATDGLTDGQVEAVMYQFLAPMLLNELQKQYRRIEEEQKTIDALSRRLEALEQQKGF